MLVRLGNFTFAVSSLAYQNLTKNFNWRWDTINVINDRQAVQYSGEGDETMSLQGVAYPVHNTLTPQTSLLAEANRKEPLIMVSATGDVLGKYVIESVNFTETNFHVSGLPHHVDFTISIRRHS